MIRFLWQEPLIFRMAFEDEKPAARRNETEAGDIRSLLFLFQIFVILAAILG